MTDEMPSPPEPKPRQPIFNPKAFEAAPVIALALAMIALHGWLDYSGTRAANEIYRDYAFIPSQFWNGEALSTLISYAMLHGSWMHLGFNAFAFYALGTACWSLMGTLRFFLFFAVTAAAGAILFAAVRPESTGVLVGVSGVIFGLLAAVKRVEFRVKALRGRDVRRSMLIFLAAIVAINVVIGIIPLQDGMGLVGEAIAWEAHVGGFLVGWVVTPWLVKFWPQ